MAAGGGLRLPILLVFAQTKTVRERPQTRADLRCCMWWHGLCLQRGGEESGCAFKGRVDLSKMGSVRISNISFFNSWYFYCVLEIIFQTKGRGGHQGYCGVRD